MDRDIRNLEQNDISGPLLCHAPPVSEAQTNALDCVLMYVRVLYNGLKHTTAWDEVKKWRGVDQLFLAAWQDFRGGNPRFEEWRRATMERVGDNSFLSMWMTMVLSPLKDHSTMRLMYPKVERILRFDCSSGNQGLQASIDGQFGEVHTKGRRELRLCAEPSLINLFYTPNEDSPLWASNLQMFTVPIPQFDESNRLATLEVERVQYILRAVVNLDSPEKIKILNDNFCELVLGEEWDYGAANVEGFLLVYAWAQDIETEPLLVDQSSVLEKSHIQRDFKRLESSLRAAFEVPLPVASPASTSLGHGVDPLQSRAATNPNDAITQPQKRKRKRKSRSAKQNLPKNAPPKPDPPENAPTGPSSKSQDDYLWQRQNLSKSQRRS